MSDINALIAGARNIPLLEGAYLDDACWDDWLALYASDCVYWVPTWRSEQALTTDPQTELSHIYYASRAGLEDRVLRIRSTHSPATVPIRRTCHSIGNVLLTRGPDQSGASLRTAWTCHVFDPRHKKSYVLFGSALYQLRLQGELWSITHKKTIVQNDYLPSMVDVYCL